MPLWIYSALLYPYQVYNIPDYDIVLHLESITHYSQEQLTHSKHCASDSAHECSHTLGRFLAKSEAV